MKKKKKELKISLNKAIIILLITVIFAIGYLGVLYFVNNNKIEEVSQEIDYKERYGLKYTYTKEISDDIILSIPYSADLKITEGETFSLIYENVESGFNMVISLYEAKYNFENYSVDKYVEEYDGITNKKNMKNDKMDICYFEQNEEEYDSRYSYYIVNYNNMILTFDVYYASQELYEKYNDIITYMISNIDIIDNNDMTQYYDVLNQGEGAYNPYQHLTMKEKNMYDKMCEYIKKSVEKGEKDFSYEMNFYSEQERNECANVFRAVIHDSEYLGLNNYNFEQGFYDHLNTCDMSFWYDDEINRKITVFELFSNSKIEQVSEKLSDKDEKIFDEKIDTIINNMPKNLSVYGKYKYLAHSICEIAEYEENSRFFSSIEKLIIDGEGDCDGYAYAYAYLCEKANLYCGIIEAKPKEQEMGHAYNCIKLGNKYYFIDTTWQDEIGDEGNFAFIYNEMINNEHDIYIKSLIEENVDNIDKLINNLGNIDWYNIQNIYIRQNVCE